MIVAGVVSDGAVFSVEGGVVIAVPLLLPAGGAVGAVDGAGGSVAGGVVAGWVGATVGGVVGVIVGSVPGVVAASVGWVPGSVGMLVASVLGWVTPIVVGSVLLFLRSSFGQSSQQVAISKIASMIASKITIRLFIGLTPFLYCCYYTISGIGLQRTFINI